MKTSKSVQIIECDNALILPSKTTDNGPRWGLGGVINENNEFVDDSFYDGGWATHGGMYQWENEEFIDEDVIYMGLYLSHWGHFLIDLITRVWAIPQLVEKNKNIKVAYLGEEEISGNNLELIKLLGVNETQLIHIKEPVRFKKVYLPQQAFKSCEWYTKEHVKMLDLIIQTALSNCTDISDVYKNDRVYFSRRKFRKAMQTEFGEEYFETVFKNNGYQILSPEDMTLQEQIYVWNNSKNIVCINGTIPLNVMFSLNKKMNLTILNKTSIKHENPFLLLEMRNINATFINIYKEPFNAYPKSLGEGPFLLWPTMEFDDYCSRNNLSNKVTSTRLHIRFWVKELEYCWSIVSLKNKINHLIKKLIPREMKQIIKKWYRK